VMIIKLYYYFIDLYHVRYDFDNRDFFGHCLVLFLSIITERCGAGSTKTLGASPRCLGDAQEQYLQMYMDL
jgi:hypothetical protein